jgi:hypothetical protein
MCEVGVVVSLLIYLRMFGFDHDFGIWFILVSRRKDSVNDGSLQDVTVSIQPIL